MGIRFVFNLKVGRAERVHRDGKWWLVAPLTTIVPGVLNGSRGPGYYPPEEVSPTVHAWNGIPLTAYHPVGIDGRHTSASAPGVWERQGLGVVRDSTFNGKLRHKGWFDEERVKRLEPRVYNALKNGQPMELSTGLYTDNEDCNGDHCNHNGRPYTWIARNHRPDHIAILPDQVGACSLNDGCGLMVNRATPKPKPVCKLGGT